MEGLIGNALISNRNHDAIVQRDLNEFGDLEKDNATLVPQNEFNRVSSLSLELPIETVSEANGLLSKTRFYKNGKAKPEHWTEKSARHKQQKRIVYLFMNPHISKFRLPCTVTMTRCGGHFLDEDDNLRVALKWVKDAIAEVLTQDFVVGRADSDKRITWRYDQVKSKAKGVKILFEF